VTGQTHTVILLRLNRSNDVIMIQNTSPWPGFNPEFPTIGGSNAEEFVMKGVSSQGLFVGVERTDFSDVRTEIYEADPEGEKPWMGYPFVGTHTEHLRIGPLALSISIRNKSMYVRVDMGSRGCTLKCAGDGGSPYKTCHSQFEYVPSGGEGGRLGSEPMITMMMANKINTKRKLVVGVLLAIR